MYTCLQLKLYSTIVHAPAGLSSSIFLRKRFQVMLLIQREKYIGVSIKIKKFKQKKEIKNLFRNPKYYLKNLKNQETQNLLPRIEACLEDTHQLFHEPP